MTDTGDLSIYWIKLGKASFPIMLSQILHYSIFLEMWEQNSLFYFKKPKKGLCKFPMAAVKITINLVT